MVLVDFKVTKLNQLEKAINPNFRRYSTQLLQDVLRFVRIKLLYQYSIYMIKKL
jgi:hypothetical protein